MANSIANFIQAQPGIRGKPTGRRRPHAARAIMTAAEIEARITHLLERLGDAAALTELVACGTMAAPAIAAHLRKGPAQSVFQGRAALCEALAALRRFDLLLEYLESGPRPGNPVLAQSEAAVQSTAARLLQPAPTPAARDALLALSGRICLTGALETLTAWGEPKVVPAMLRCLEDDTARAAALTGLQHLASNHVLLEAALVPAYYPSARRRRCDCLRLLSRRVLDPAASRRLLPRCTDRDPVYAAAACVTLLSQPLGERDLETVADAALHLSETVPWWICLDLETALARARVPLSDWWKRRSASPMRPAAAALLRRAERLAEH